VNTWAGEIQAGSYCLMDTTYAHAGAPFAQALTVLASVISANPGGWYVADLGLKALGMDHGNPSLEGASVWYCADEHTVFSADGGTFEVGQRVRFAPAHVDPTVALHERMHLVDFGVDGGEVVETWDVDLRGW
jgi:D-serine deaminase-like pyridoxal phosphate-dependent protein